MAKFDFDIDEFKSRLDIINQFDGNLVYGAKNYHKQTKRTGVGRPGEGKMVREQARVIDDTGKDRYIRKEGCWEAVNQCPVCDNRDSDFFLTRMGLDIYRCTDCGHRYMNPRIKFDTLVKLYADDKTASDVYTQPVQVDIDRKKYQYGLDLIEKLGPPAMKKIMDIGCGSGGFLKIANENGWEYCVGVDANERYSDIYEETRGVQFLQTSFEHIDHEKIGSEYDCISMWNVLEHLYDIQQIISDVRRMLKPGGLMFIMVPNVESLASRIIRERSATFNWKHVSHFTRNSLDRLMSSCGFTAVHYETVISEIDNVKSYLSGEYPYHGYGDPAGLFDFITPEYIHSNFLGSRMIGIFRND